jgi:hypothetical protein
MWRNMRGATFNEVIISLAVVSILAGYGVKHLIRIVPDYHLASAARFFLSYIQEAKARAVYRGTICYLDLDPEGDGNLESGPIALWEDRNDNHHKDHLEKSDTLFELRSFSGVHFQAYPVELGGPERGPNNTKIDAGGGDGVSFSQNRIKFNPNGTCSTGSIYLHSSSGRTFAIRLRYNGLAQVWFYNGQNWERR